MIFLNTLVDEKKTIATTKRYLKQYPRLKTIARSTSTLQSNWNVSDKIKSGTISNTHEDRLLNRIAITQEVEEIERAISCLNESFKTILTEKYIKRQKNDFVLYQDMNMSEASFYKASKNALLDFACVFNNGSLLQYLDS
ncbi:TPA: ArpU family transcriptional regulator [Streptococcus suis]|uniref:ArpU family phage packaging/lysis transcriptional regulator n=1 Tax=Streptococcus suis TaxID=1307 RepID=UPI00209BE267|nr:ArpU family phage packaging/lysis transcriptional regulator [Streptococcus suis]MCO8200925.1 ArpU family transcriptional regulator [Streptococcus suis]MCO8218451.1 ArpU family transcriptional regulator [Streptococcus suis]HEM3468299.1 ArpU family transcriptional regulator [Streptococcus suis]HEM3479011.1 ArpU family transcriptional regulator [Streptococcus suis]